MRRRWRCALVAGERALPAVEAIVWKVLLADVLNSVGVSEAGGGAVFVAKRIAKADVALLIQTFMSSLNGTLTFAVLLLDPTIRRALAEAVVVDSSRHAGEAGRGARRTAEEAAEDGVAFKVATGVGDQAV
ncbi:hypothetical protein HK101_005237 [Irineochytrium annulatum]|nr:hypothetical protein HK101_005237 [Irineochytrium annulatum]